MELQQLIEKWTKEMADIKSHIKQHEDTFGHPAVTSRERYKAISDMLADVKQLNLPPVSNSLPVNYLQTEMIKAIKELAKESTAPDKDTPDWMENDIKRGMQWMHKRLTGNDC
jgi:F0F1-type ATP synthase delta subunit